MKLKKLNRNLSVCKLASPDNVDLTKDFYFLSKTRRDVTLVCNTSEAPEDCIAREDGWKAFVIDEVMDLNTVGVMAELSGILAKQKISIYALSSYSTDYILVKEHQFEAATFALAQEGYSFTE